MNYILKGVLRKIFTQYLNLHENKLDLQSGIIKLPMGDINHEKLNRKLAPLRLRIAASSYKNLIIHIPLTQLTSKPIKLSIEVLDIVVYRTISAQGRSPQSSPKKREEEQLQDETGKQGYFRNLINRLLYNMEVSMERINLRLIEEQEEKVNTAEQQSLQKVEKREASFILHSLSLRNSLVILEANIVKKSLTLTQLHLKHPTAQLKLKDLNLCFDFTNKKISLIAILGSISFEIIQLPLDHIEPILTKKKSKKAIEPPQKRQTIEMSMYVKANHIKLISHLLQVNAINTEVRLSQCSASQDVCLSFQRINVVNTQSEFRQKELLWVGYLPCSQQVKLFSEYEDSIIKHCQIKIKRYQEGKGSISAKVVHLQMGVDINEVKILLDHLVQYKDKLKAFMQIIQNMERQTIQNEVHSKNISLLFQAVIYRLKFICIYEQTAIKVFGSFKAFSTLLKPTKKIEGVDENSINFKIHQLGGKVKDYRIVDLNQLEGRKTEKDLILNGNSLQVQCSVSLLDSLNEFISHANRDLVYYKQKFDGLIAQKVQDQIKQKKAEEQNKIQQRKLPRIYLKMNQIIIKVGQLAQHIHSNTQKGRNEIEELLFISIIDVEINSLLVSLISNGLKCNCEIICYLSSPYTLQRTPLTNQLQIGVSFNLLTTELQINLKNNLILLLQDQFINIAYKLLDRKNIWCILTNKTHQSISLLQKTTIPIQLPNNISLQLHKIDINSRQSKHIFWLDDESFKLQMGHYTSSSIGLVRDEELQQIEGGRLQAQRDLQLRENGENQYILRFIYNKLGNLCELIIDNRLTIQSKTHPYVINFRGHTHSITDDSSMINWVSELEDLFEDCRQVEFLYAERHFGMEQLMNNQQFILFGLFEKGTKLYESCIVGMKSLKSMHYTITPFLIIENTLSQALQIEIIERKSQERQKIVIKSGQKKQFGHNGKFDYYLKQLTVKIGLLDEQGNISHEGEGLYLNTFFMAAQKTNSSIQLRSSRPQNYSRRLLLLEQSLSLKTKILTFRSGLYVHNRTAFMVSLRLKDEPTAELSIEPNQNGEWNYRLKNDTLIEIVLIGQMQSRIELKYGDLREMKILSFNFLRIGEGWYNILLRAEARQVERGQVLQIQSFVDLVNLCQQIDSIFIQDFLEVAADKRSYLPLSATSLNKYNNRCVAIDDLNKIYAEIFLTTKVTDRPLSLKLNGQSLLLGDLVRSSSQELAVRNDRYVITLLKDMNGRKITFYLTDRLYSSQTHYTVMANQSSHYLLLSDDSDYAPLFSPSISQSTYPLRLLVTPTSLTCLLNREPEVLLCDKYEKHLQKATKPALQKRSIKLQRCDFQNITLIEAGQAKGANNSRKQLTTKGIEVRLRMFGRLQVSIGVRLLTVRLLQCGKLDCLLQDIAVKNEQTKDHLLRIPEQTYLLLEASALRDGHFYLLRNLFLKCKHIIVNVKRQMPYALLPLLQALSARLGGQEEQENHQEAGRRWGEQIRRSKGQEKLRRLVKEVLFLVRTVFIHEVHLSLTIQLESISFSNVIILPQFQLQQRFLRGRDFQQQLTNYYLTNLLAKFPKLAFLITNFRSPLNTLRLFFNLREALKQKIHTPVLITFPAEPLPHNPFLFSLQRWNYIISCLHSSFGKNQHEKAIKLVGALRRENGYLLVSSHEILWQQAGQWRVLDLRELQIGRVIRGRSSSELVLRFRRGEKIVMVEEHKNCLKLLGCIQQLLL